MESFNNRVVLITGAASGIGRQLALTLAAEGARIAALDLRADALDSLAGGLKGRAVACAVADVTDLPAVRAAVARLEGELGPTDLLVASAGIGRETRADPFRAEDFTAHVQINLIGVANVLDAVLPGMCTRRRGHVAALSSMASYRGLPRMAGYCASKAGLNSLLDSLRVELRPLGIHVTTICPGWVRTPMTAPLDPPPTDMMDVSEAVRRIVAALRARKPFVAFPAGTTWKVRLLRHTPLAVSDWMTRHWARKMKN